MARKNIFEILQAKGLFLGSPFVKSSRARSIHLRMELV